MKWLKDSILLFVFGLLFVSCSKDEIQSRFTIIAHQGYWKAAAGASNSIRGLKESVELGIEGVELDVRVTADDSLILCHDERYGDYNVARSSFEQIRTVRLPDGSLVPTLRECVHEASNHRHCLLFIDVKDKKALGSINEILVEHNTVSQAVLLLPLAKMAEVRELNPQLKVMVMDETPDLDKVKESGAHGVSLSLNALKSKPELLKKAHDMGLKVNTWVIKSESEIIWCSLYDVDYVTTDLPLECKHYLYQ